MNISEFLLARVAMDEAIGRAYERLEAPGWISRFTREAAANRRIVELHTPTDLATECYSCRYPLEVWPCETLLALASIYADSPDFDPAWKLNS